MKSPSTLKSEARKFCNWRKRQGGKVLDLRVFNGPDRERRRQLRDASRDPDVMASVDVIFRRNERHGRYA